MESQLLNKLQIKPKPKKNIDSILIIEHNVIISF